LCTRPITLCLLLLPTTPSPLSSPPPVFSPAALSLTARHALPPTSMHARNLHRSIRRPTRGPLHSLRVYESPNSSTRILPVSTPRSSHVLLTNLQLPIPPCPRRRPVHRSRNQCPVQALSTPTACQLDRHEWWPLKGYSGACLLLLRPTGPLILHTPSSDPIIYENPRNRKIHHKFAFALLSYHSTAQLFLVCPHCLQVHPSIVSPSRCTVTLVWMDFPHSPACFTGLAWQLQCGITAAPPPEGLPLSRCVVPSPIDIANFSGRDIRPSTHPFLDSPKFYRSSLSQDPPAYRTATGSFSLFVASKFHVPHILCCCPPSTVPYILRAANPRFCGA
jgi:hypothetical protein